MIAFYTPGGRSNLEIRAVSQKLRYQELPADCSRYDGITKNSFYRLA